MLSTWVPSTIVKKVGSSSCISSFFCFFFLSTCKCWNLPVETFCAIKSWLRNLKPSSERLSTGIYPCRKPSLKKLKTWLRSRTPASLASRHQEKTWSLSPGMGDESKILKMSAKCSCESCLPDARASSVKNLKRSLICSSWENGWRRTSSSRLFSLFASSA